MIISRHTWLIAASTVCALVHCAAQEAEQVKVRFVSFPRSDDPKPVELLVGDKQTIPVDLPTNIISQPHSIRKPSAWTIGKTITDDKGQSTFKVFGTAPAIDATEQIVLCIRKGKTDEEGFTLIPLDGRGNGFGGGKYIFFNASKVDIACKIGDATAVVKPLDHKLVEPKPDEVINEREMLFVYLYFRRETEATPFYSSSWRYSKNARTMVFLFHDNDSTALKLHVIRDYLEQ